MKKIVALFMAMILALSLLCACGGEDEKKNSSPSNTNDTPQSSDDAVINW